MFHAISAFCNAGFDIMGPAGGGSLTTYEFNPVVNTVIMLLIIIGGLGSIAGGIFGAGFFVLLPLALTHIPHWLGLPLSTAAATYLEHMIFGGLIVFFLIVEPHGLARLWGTARQKLRIWPFPH